MAHKYGQFHYWSAVAHETLQYIPVPESFEGKIAGVTYTQRNHVIPTPRIPTNKRLRPRQSYRAPREYVRAGQQQHAAFRYHHFDVVEKAQPWLQGLDLGVGGTVVARRMKREEMWESMALEKGDGFAEFTAELEDDDDDDDVKSVVRYELEEGEGDEQGVVGRTDGERDGESSAIRKAKEQWKRTTRRILSRCRGFARAWVE